jgi:hypothetical protein
MTLKSASKILFFCLFLFNFQKTYAQEFETNMRKAYLLLTIAQERDRQALEILDDIKTKRIRNEEDIIDSQENPKSITKKDKEKLTNQLKMYKKQEADALKNRREASAFLTEITELIKAPEKKRAKYIADYEKKNGSFDYIKSTDNTVVNTQTPPQDSANTGQSDTQSSDKVAVLETDPNVPVVIDSKSGSSSEGKKYDKPKKGTPTTPTNQPRKYDPKLDVMLNPPVADCKLAFDGVDKFTQRKKRETMPQILFRHTEDFMKSTMKDKDYINCEAMASRVQGGFNYLNLTFTIMTKDAQKSFGFLDRGTLFVFKLINGKIVTLTNTKTDIGIVDANNGTTTYRAQLQMQNGDAKALMETELDVVRVAWSAGYEDYEIYYMDVLMNLFKCLDKENK